MFEIGSEFWTEKEENGSGLKSLIPGGTSVVYTLSGRTALDLVIRDVLTRRKAQSVYMPSYCCHTMIEPFLRNGVRVEFYDVAATEEGIKGSLAENECDLVFLIDYFGFTNGDNKAFAEKERARGKTVFYDATHSLFRTENDYSAYDYVFGSFRKWTSINAGFAFRRGEWAKELVLKQNEEYAKLRNASFDLKAEYIRNPVSVEKNRFLSSFQSAEEMLETDYRDYAPDARSGEILNRPDIAKIREARRGNAELLIEGLKKCSGVFLPYKSVKDEECPLFVPVMFKKERNAIRKYLIDRSVYLPVHWPVSPLHCLKPETGKIYEEEISFVCDQRYGAADMERMVELIRQYE